MRCLGQIANRRSAEQFVAFLLVNGISTQVEPSSDSLDHWEIWVREEDKMPEAVELLREFLTDQGDPKYQQAVKQANSVIQQQIQQRSAAVENVRKVQYRSDSFNDRKIPPITMTLIVLSCLVSLFNNFGGPDPSNEIGQSISRQMLFVNRTQYIESNLDPLVNLKQGQIWRTITPIFVHLHEFHLFFNMLSLWIMGRICERWLGTNRYVLFVLLAAILPNLLQALAPAKLGGNPLFGGVSGVVYAMFAFIWIRSLLNPSLGIFVPLPILVLMLAPLAIGLSGLVPNLGLADLCHLGGLIVGVIMAQIVERAHRG